MRYDQMDCINPHCKRKAVTRGLCTCCYRNITRYIKRGVITEEQAILSGKMEPKHKPLYSESYKWFTNDTIEPLDEHPEICIVDGCSHEACVRGLCRRHYEQAHQIVRSGITSFDDLLSKNKILRPNIKKKAVEWLIT